MSKQKATKENNIAKIKELLESGKTHKEIIDMNDSFGVGKATIKNYLQEIEAMSKTVDVEVPEFETEDIETTENAETPTGADAKTADEKPFVLEGSKDSHRIDVKALNFKTPTGADANFIWVALENIEFDKKGVTRKSKPQLQCYTERTWKTAKQYMGNTDYKVLFHPKAK